MSMSEKISDSFIGLREKLGIITKRNMVEQLEIVDEQLLLEALEQMKSDSNEAGDQWPYLMTLINDGKMSPEFVKNNQWYFSLSYLLDTQILSFEDCKAKIPTYFNHLTKKQFDDAPLWFKVKYSNLSEISHISESGASKITFKFEEKHYAFQESKLLQVILQSHQNIFYAPIETAIRFEVVSGKYYFDNITHGFDLDFTDNDIEQFKPLLEYIYLKLRSNAQEIKDNAKQIASSTQDKSGFNPILAAALGLGAGVLLDEALEE